MPRATVLIPTHDHADTIEYAIKSVQNQTIKDLEIFIVGDGQPKRTDHIIKNMMKSDDRIFYFPNVKGEGYGELYRHEALKKAKSEFICYLGDDDMWLEDHVEVMIKHLTTFDFVHVYQLNCDLQGNFDLLIGDIQEPGIKPKMLEQRYNFFGLSAAGHTMTAYHKLPYGWRPKPIDLYSDLHMWRQFLSQNWCTFKTIPRATVLKLPSPERAEISTDQRIAELEHWWVQIKNKQVEARIEAHCQDRLVKGYMSANRLFQMANVLASAEQIEFARELYQKAIYIKPNLLRYQVKFGQWLQKIGDSEAALEVYQAGLINFPEDTFFHYQSAKIYSQTNKFARAEQHYLQTIKLNPDHAPAHVQLGALYIKEKQYKKAEAKLLNIIEVVPDLFNAYFHLSTVYMRQDKLKLSLEFIDRALELKPSKNAFKKRRSAIVSKIK